MIPQISPQSEMGGETDRLTAGVRRLQITGCVEPRLAGFTHLVTVWLAGVR